MLYFKTCDKASSSFMRQLGSGSITGGDEQLFCLEPHPNPRSRWTNQRNPDHLLCQPQQSFRWTTQGCNPWPNLCQLSSPKSRTRKDLPRSWWQSYQLSRRRQHTNIRHYHCKTCHQQHNLNERYQIPVLDIHNFYLGTPMERYKYMKMPLTLIPQ